MEQNLHETRFMIKNGCLAVCCAGVVLSVIFMIFLPFSYHLLFGWLHYLDERLPHAKVDLQSILFSFVVLGLLLFFLHLSQMMLARIRQAMAWDINRSVAIFMLLMLLSIVGISFVSVGHQTFWLVQSQESLIAHFTAFRSMTKNNLKQIGLSLSNYHDANSEIPRLYLSDSQGTPLHSWTTQILPFLEENELYDKIQFDKPWNDPVNANTMEIPLVISKNNPNYISALPPEKYAGLTFAANPYVLRPLATTFKSINDGSSNTFIAGTVCYKMSAWGDPGNFRDPLLGLNHSAKSFGRLHQNIPTMILMADGAVRFFSAENEHKSPGVWLKIALPDNGVPAPEEF